MDDEQLCDTPLWDGDLPLGSVGPYAACWDRSVAGDTRQPLPSVAGCVYAQVVAGVGCRADARREMH